MKKPISALLASALVLLSPGLPCYEALASEIGSSGPKVPGAAALPGASEHGAPKAELPALPESSVLPAITAPGGVEVPGASQTPSSEQASSDSVQAQPPSAEAGAERVSATPAELKASQSVLESPASSAAASQAAAAPEEKALDPRIEALAAGLADKKSDKFSLLSRLFDGFGRRKPSSEPVIGKASPVANALVAASARADAGVAIPAPAISEPSKLGAWLARVKSAFNLSQFSETGRGYIAGQLLLITALTVYLSSIPLMAVAITGNAAMAGAVRAVHYWSFAGASLFAGPVVARVPMKRMLVGSTIARAALFGAIGLLAMPAALPWWLYLSLVGVNGAVVAGNHLVDMKGGGALKIFTGKEQIEKAIYLRNIMWNGMMLFLPALFGLPMDWLSAKFSPAVGAGAGYTLFGVLMAAAAWVYQTKVKVVKDGPAPKPSAGLADAAAKVWARKSGKAGFVLMALGVLALAGLPALGVAAAVAGVALLAAGIIGAFYWNAVKVLAGDSVLALRSGLAVLENFVEDALTTVIMPAIAYATDKGDGTFRSGVLMGSTTLAGLIVGNFIYLRAQKLEKKIGLSRLLTRMTFAAAFGFLPSILLWGASTPLVVAFGAFLAMELLFSPIKSRMETLLNTTIDANPQAAALSSKLFSLMNFVETMAAGAGALAFAWIFNNAGAGSALTRALGVGAPMKVVTLAMAAISLSYVFGLRRLKAQLARPVRRDHKGYTPDTAALSARLREAAALAARLVERRSALEDRVARRDGLSRRLATVPGRLLGGLLPRMLAGRSVEIEVMTAEERADFAAAGALIKEARERAEKTGAVLGLGAKVGRAQELLAEGNREEASRELSAAAELADSALAQAQAMAKLSAQLKRMGLAAPREEKVAGPADATRPAVAFLAHGSVYKLAIAQEGGRQAPGDFHLVLDPSWIVSEAAADGRTRLFLKKGLYFDKEGGPVLVDYESPRSVGYFADYYTPGSNDREDGLVLEKDLDVPQSSSAELERVTNDKLLTRLLMAAKGVAVPATLGLLLAAHPLRAQAAELSSGPVRVAPMTEDRAALRAEVEKFLGGYRGAEVVVKPSGPRYHSAIGVKFFGRGEVDAIVDHALTLAKDERMGPDGAVLIDERLLPPPLYLRAGGPAEEGGKFGFVGDKVAVRWHPRAAIPSLEKSRSKDKKDWNLRVFAARTPEGGFAAAGYFVRAGTWGLPTSGEPADPADAAAMLPFEDAVAALRAQHGLLAADEEVDDLRRRLDELGARALSALAESEARRERREGEPRQAQTDFVGFDVALVLREGKLVPVVFEANDHDSGGQWQVDQFYPGEPGQSSRAFVATALARARAARPFVKP